MSDLIQAVIDQFSGRTVRKFARHNGTSKSQTNVALKALVPILVNALVKNSSSQEGAASLFSALQKDHDGSVLDSITDLVRNPNSSSGDGIIRHTLGSNAGVVEQFISRISGLNSDQVGSLMKTVAPILMGLLGKQQQQGGFGIADLIGFLSQNRDQSSSQERQGLGLIGRLLDSDGDGSVLDDVASLAFSFLSRR